MIAEFNSHFRRHFNACQGYLKLEMIDDAWDELALISNEYQTRPEVIQLRVWVLMKQQRWQEALDGAEELCQLLPNIAVPYLDAAYCLHELQRTQDARQKLLSGPVDLQDYPTFHYNLACYEAILGHTKSAQYHLNEAIRLDPKYQTEAEHDPDLLPLIQC